MTLTKDGLSWGRFLSTKPHFRTPEEPVRAGQGLQPAVVCLVPDVIFSGESRGCQVTKADACPNLRKDLEMQRTMPCEVLLHTHAKLELLRGLLSIFCNAYVAIVRKSFFQRLFGGGEADADDMEDGLVSAGDGS